MPAAAVGIGSAVIGGVSSKKAGKQAAAGQRASAAVQREALQFSKQQYREGVQRLSPFRAAGLEAMDLYMRQLRRGPGGAELPEFQGLDPAKIAEDPGYQFRLSQGIQATERATAKAGGRFGGRRGIALQQFAQGLASEEYGKAFGREVQKFGLDYQRASDIEGRRQSYLQRLAGIMGSGQSAAGAASNLGMEAAGQVGTAARGIGGAIAGAASAQAAGTMGAGRAIYGGISDIAGAFASGGFGTSLRYGTGMGTEQTRMLAEQDAGLF